MKSRSLLLAGLVLFGALGVALASSSRPAIAPIDIGPNESLSTADRAYISYVYPRIAALDSELTDIRGLVEERSRNLFALSAGGDRIRELLEQIDRAPRADDLDSSLVTLHGRIETLGDSVTGILDGAQRSLSRFDFSVLPDLIPRFKTASEEVSAIRRDLQARGAVGGPGTLKQSVS